MYKNIWSYWALVIFSAAGIVGCGKTEDPGVTPPIPPIPPVCIPGPGIQCPPIGGPGVGGCQPITQPLVFTAQGMTVTSANIYAGQIPRQQTYGQVFMGGQPVGTPNYSRSTHEGRIDLTIAPLGGVGGIAYPGVGQGAYAGFGVVTLSSASHQQINQALQSGQIQVPPSPTGVPCVSGIALNLGHTNGRAIGGYVYLYLNGSTTNGWSSYL